MPLPLRQLIFVESRDQTIPGSFPKKTLGTRMEVLWANLRPKRLPRGISNIIVAVVYQPPAADDATMKDYLISSLEILEIKYPNCAIVLAGDFNKTLLALLQSAVKVFQLKPVVDFPTRGDRTLDQVFTNLTEYFSSPCSLPAFGLSDHQTIFISARIRDKTSKPKRKLITTRDKRPSKIASVGRFLQQVLWSDLFFPAQSSEDKLNILTDIINFGLNTIMPVSTIKIHESDRPWMNTNLKQLIIVSCDVGSNDRNTEDINDAWGYYGYCVVLVCTLFRKAE